MQIYKNLGRESNVVAFEVASDSITVKFRSGTHTLYKYTYSSAGQNAVESMKVLANAGKGLNSFIGHNRPKFASKAA